jgi:TPR repeat protein
MRERFASPSLRIPLRAFVCYLALGIATARGQGSSPTPPAESPEQKPVQSRLTSAEISGLRAKAEKGDASAQLALGEAYEGGNGISKSDVSAGKWYRKAADQGNSDAEARLGVMYRLGLGVTQDKEEAVRWYRKAAKQGNPQAMFNLGISYYNGDGVVSNSNLAYAWFLLAQDGGNHAADEAVKRSAEEGERLGATPDALLQVAAMYEKGDDLPQSYSEAAKWYRKAAGLSPLAEVKLANLLIDGKGVAQDYGEAMTLCQSAAKQRFAPGQYCVGFLHQRGLGTQADPKEAAKWYEDASKGGNIAAMTALAKMYWKGEGVGVDRPEAYYLFFQSSRRGFPDAKAQAQMLWQEMSKDEIKHLEKKLRDFHFDPKKVFDYVQGQTTPDAPKESSQP